jgi:hypothetical protein
MADISVEQDSGRKTTWIWAAVAILAVVGLMAWLASQSENLERAAIVEGDAPAASADERRLTADRVELAELSNNPDAYAGQTVAVENAQVAAALGPRAFWAEIPGQNPFLVILGTNVQDVQMPVAGQRLDLQGTVQPVTEQQLDEWVTAETVAAGSRDEAAFATHFLLANTGWVRQ